MPLTLLSAGACEVRNVWCCCCCCCCSRSGEENEEEGKEPKGAALKPLVVVVVGVGVGDGVDDCIVVVDGEAMAAVAM